MTKTTVTAAKRARKSAKAAKADPAPIGAAARVITKIVGANSGQDTLATLADGTSAKVTGMAAKVGDNYDDIHRAHLAALRTEREAHPLPAQLARGVEARKAPHSAKAVQDQPKAAKPAAAKKAERKAARAARAAPKADDPRKITIVDKKFSFGGDGTARRLSWDACKASKTVAAYLKAGGKAKYLPRWVASGAIKLVG